MTKDYAAALNHAVMGNYQVLITKTAQSKLLVRYRISMNLYKLIFIHVYTDLNTQVRNYISVVVRSMTRKLTS